MSGSESEGEGDVIRPYGDKDPERDSSEESEEDDPEEARRIADGFIVDEDEEEEEEDDEAERRRRRKERKKKRRRRERMRREQEDLSEDDLDLLNENAGYIGSSRPLKRLRRRSGSGSDDNLPRLQDMFAVDEDRLDDDDDDLGDFIEEDDEDIDRNETEEQRRQRKREEKQRRREAARARPELAGVDKDLWNEVYEVFGDGHEYDWALEGEDGMDLDEDETEKRELRLEDVFDPAEIKARRLQDEDKAIVAVDKPERHQLVNSTLSDNPVQAPDTLFPPPDIAARWAFNKISERTMYVFCNMFDEGQYPMPTMDNPHPVSPERRPDLGEGFIDVVSKALNMMFTEHFEVPYLWHYKRDAFSVLENQGQSSVQFLDREELWSLYNLGIRFRAIYERNQQTRGLWNKIRNLRPDVKDEYLTSTLLTSVCTMSIEAAAEGADWLTYHYASDIKTIKETEALNDNAKRLPSRISHEDFRTGPIVKLAEAIGISVPQVATTFNEVDGTPVPPENPDKMPDELAAEFSGPETHFLTPHDALRAARKILVSDFAHDPTIRQQARDFIQAVGTVTVTPTDRGMTVIDEFHAYYNFKFLTNKPTELFKDSPQFLHILRGEEEGLLTSEISVPEEQLENFKITLLRCCQSNEGTALSEAWNEIRREAVESAVNGHFMPTAKKWLREHLRQTAEEFVADRCQMELERRANVRPFSRPNVNTGETPTVLAITIGRGNVSDAVVAVLLSSDGSVRGSYKFDNLRDLEPRDSFIEVVTKRRPTVIVIGGLSIHTGRLKEDATGALRELAMRDQDIRPPVSENFSSHDEYEDAVADFDRALQQHLTPLVFVDDATARLYMNSEEAEKEHPELPINGRFALGLARYAQNPLNEYARLGKQIVNITYVDYHQKLVPEERLLLHLERGLVNSVCLAGVEINTAVADPYTRALLPFVAGLGPRKADSLVTAINKQGSLINRLQLSEYALVGPTIFENIAGFLIIDNDLKDFQLEAGDAHDQSEPLDMTRIHPEDYEFAQKMCQDALDLDAEDVADQHKSAVVLQLMQDEDRSRKLGELNLDDFAFNLQRQGEGNKRHTLGAIVTELIHWHADRRPHFQEPTKWEIMTMLTGETEKTIGRGLLVTATVRRALANRVFSQLESGVDAILEREYVSDDDQSFSSCDQLFRQRQAFKAVVISPEPERFQVRVSTRKSDIAQSVPFVQPFREDPFNDLDRQRMAEEASAQKRRRKAGAVKRVVNHPNWHIMNSGQAEQFLAPLQRGDVVIRPSSKGPDHIAVTWKVDEDVYQHIDVHEINKPNEYTLGRILRIANKYSYTDLDELIVNHIHAVAKKFDELEAHEKFRPEAELESYLKNYVQAHPGRSMYGFSIDSDHPGYIKLCFLNKSTKDGGVIQTWPVRVLPGAYQLGSAEVPGMTELCNAFKAQYSSRLAEQGGGGKTPGIRMAARTPMGSRTPGMGSRTPAMRGGATPMQGYASGRTPNPGYGAPMGGRTPMRPPPGGGGYGMPPPPGPGYQQGPPGRFGGPGPGPGGYGGPPPPPPNGGAPGSGMNPDRAAMIARGNGRY